MCEYVIKATTTNPLKKDKRDITSCTKAIMILLDGDSLPAKKTISDSEQNARRQWIEKRIATHRLLEMKLYAVKNLSKEDESDKSSSDDSVKAKAENSSKEAAKDLSSEYDSEDAKESEEDEIPTKADTKTTKKESGGSSDGSSDEWIMMDYDNIV
ncbi:unnamed protein product [Arabidopsis arenosa]|uniref:Uncharacterized protein n=1 Tax=Arabidopsis arenosa TaxID=38785 RepID=A0A8S1ZGQ8_ARAAE|nr:unnamed protein product [Arabidopsis arenosa]